MKIKYTATYRQLRSVYERYKSSRDKEKFLRENESDIILFEAAARELKRLGAVPLPTTESMKAEMDALAVEKDRLLEEYRTAKAKVREYEISKQNVNALLSVPKEPEQQRKQELE